MTPGLPFKVKTPDLLRDGLRGWSWVASDVQDMLLWQCEYVHHEYGMPVVVTCFGRTADDQEAIYLPTMLQELAHQGVHDPVSEQMAKERARKKFSWHCIPRIGAAVGRCRAYDLRDWVFTEPQRNDLVTITRRKYPTAEVLDHKVQGGARHLHFALPLKDRPEVWV